MTDTQEAMRERREQECMAAFEAKYIENENGENPPSRLQGGGYEDYRLHAEYIKFRIGYIAATAQSAEKIARLESALHGLLTAHRITVSRWVPDSVYAAESKLDAIREAVKTAEELLASLPPAPKE